MTNDETWNSAASSSTASPSTVTAFGANEFGRNLIHGHRVSFVRTRSLIRQSARKPTEVDAAPHVAWKPPFDRSTDTTGPDGASHPFCPSCLRTFQFGRAKAGVAAGTRQFVLRATTAGCGRRSLHSIRLWHLDEALTRRSGTSGRSFPDLAFCLAFVLIRLL